MRKTKKTTLILALICAGFVPLYAARPAGSRSQLKHPAAFELLEKYGAAQRAMRSFTAKLESSREVFSSPTTGRRPRRQRMYAEGDVRFDGRRACFRKASWGQISQNDYYEKDKPYYLSALWDGATFIHYRPEREGWNFLMRVYRPGPSVIDGTYKLPEAEPIEQGGDQ